MWATIASAARGPAKTSSGTFRSAESRPTAPGAKEAAPLPPPLLLLLVVVVLRLDPEDPSPVPGDLGEVGSMAEAPQGRPDRPRGGLQPEELRK